MAADTAHYWHCTSSITDWISTLLQHATRIQAMQNRCRKTHSFLYSNPSPEKWPGLFDWSQAKDTKMRQWPQLNHGWLGQRANDMHCEHATLPDHLRCQLAKTHKNPTNMNWLRDCAARCIRPTGDETTYLQSYHYATWNATCTIPMLALNREIFTPVCPMSLEGQSTTSNTKYSTFNTHPPANLGYIEQNKLLLATKIAEYK